MDSDHEGSEVSRGVRRLLSRARVIWDGSPAQARALPRVMPPSFYKFDGMGTFSKRLLCFSTFSNPARMFDKKKDIAESLARLQKYYTSGKTVHHLGEAAIRKLWLDEQKCLCAVNPETQEIICALRRTSLSLSTCFSTLA